MAKKVAKKSLPVGTDVLKGATIVYVDYDGSLEATKDGKRYRTEVEQDWGYCYCFDYEASSCSCTPTMTVTVREIDG